MKNTTTTHGGIKNEHMFIISIQSVLLVSVTLLTTKSLTELRVQGPLPILVVVFLFPFVLVISLLMITLFIRTSNMIKMIMLLTVYVFKLVMPYVVFNGHVNYDTPVHYLSGLYLRDVGYSNKFMYHNWPHALILASIYNTVAGFKYPLDVSLIAITARMLVPLIMYVLGKNVFKLNNRSLYIMLMTLIVFEPFILHFCPQIIAVSLTLYCFSALLKVIIAVRLPHVMSFIAFFGALLFTHGMYSISISVYITILWLLVILKGLCVGQASVFSYSKRITWLLLTVLTLVLFYNVFITIFVTRNVFETVRLLVSGGTVRLDVYSTLIDDPHLQYQYVIIRLINLVATLILLGIPAIYASAKFIYYFFKKEKYNAEEFLFTQLFTYVALHFLFYATLEIGFRTGVVERYYQVAAITGTLLSGIFYENTTLSSNKYYLRALLKILFYGLLVILPVSVITTPSYTTLFRWPYTLNELEMARFISNHLSGYSVVLTGDKNLIQQVALESYLKETRYTDILYSNLLDINSIHQTYSYPRGILILVNKLTVFKTSDIPGLSLSLLRKHINSISDYLSRVYDDLHNQAYIG